jgi:hypothetical protein
VKAVHLSCTATSYSVTVKAKMRPDDEVFEQAVSHEAGHVLVAYCFGISVREIAYAIKSEFDGRIISAIADPSGAANEEEKRRHCLVASAGIAGEVVGKGTYDHVNLKPGNPDKLVVRALAGAGLTDFLEPAKEIIQRNRKAFDRLCSALRERYPAVREQIISSGQPGIYALLDKEDLDKILAGVTPTGKAKPPRERSRAKRSNKAKNARKRSSQEPTGKAKEPRKRS